MNLFFIYVCLLTEIEFDVGVEGQLTYVWPLLCVNYHLSYCVHIPCLIHLDWPNLEISSDVFASFCVGLCCYLFLFERWNFASFASLYLYVPDEGSLLTKYRDCTTSNDFELYIYIYVCVCVCVLFYFIIMFCRTCWEVSKC